MVFAFRATHINLISLKQGWIFKHKLKVEDPEHDPIFLFWLRLHLPKEYKIHSQSIWVFTHCKSHENLRVSQKLAHCGSSSWSSVHRYSLWFTYYLRLKDPLKKADPALSLHKASPLPPPGSREVHSSAVILKRVKAQWANHSGIAGTWEVDQKGNGDLR